MRVRGVTVEQEERVGDPWSVLLKPHWTNPDTFQQHQLTLTVTIPGRDSETGIGKGRRCGSST